jgi:hypothetical protein
MKDNAVRRGDRLQNYALVSYLSADFQTQPLSQASGALRLDLR